MPTPAARGHADRTDALPGIAAGLLGWAAPSFRAFSLDAARAREVNQFVQAVHYARSEAIKRNGVVSSCPSLDGATCTAATGWQAGWLVFVNLDHDSPADRDADEELLHVYEPWPDGQITSNRTTLSFRAFGQSGVTATVAFCDDRAALGPRGHHQPDRSPTNLGTQRVGWRACLRLSRVERTCRRRHQASCQSGFHAHRGVDCGHRARRRPAGCGAMLVNSLQTSRLALQRSQAVILAADLAERIRANATAAAAFALAEDTMLAGSARLVHRADALHSGRDRGASNSRPGTRWCSRRCRQPARP